MTLKEIRLLDEEIDLRLVRENKHKRPLCLLELLKLEKFKILTDKLVWYHIVNTWDLCENNHTQKEIWNELFSLRKVPTHYTEHLPDEMYIFRGGNPKGISWSLSNEIGQWFAERYGHNKKFWGMYIKKSDVLFYNNLREEQEVVIIPKTIMNILR